MNLNKTWAAASVLVASALGLSAPAAAVVTMTDYDISFVSGTAFASSGAKTEPGEYQDRFHFHIDETMTFSGSLSTQRLRDLDGLIVSDLDFGNTLIPDGVHLDGFYFDVPLGGSDELEVVNLATITIGPGDHVLTVNYTVQTASQVNGAAYSGPLFLAGAVPEPASWAMLIMGLGTVGASMRRRQKVSQISFA